MTKASPCSSTFNIRRCSAVPRSIVHQCRSGFHGEVVLTELDTVAQARIVGLNGQYFLKNGGNFVISIKASCIDSTAVPEAVFAREVKKLQEMQMKPKEQVHLCAVGFPAWHAVSSCLLVKLEAVNVLQLTFYLLFVSSFCQTAGLGLFPKSN